MWRGCLASPVDDLVLIASPVCIEWISLSYNWQCNGYDCGEDSPLLYTPGEVSYVCCVYCGNDGVKTKSMFSVTSRMPAANGKEKVQYSWVCFKCDASSLLRAYGLWLDGELDNGSSQMCLAFNNSPLSLLDTNFHCANVEVYSCE